MLLLRHNKQNKNKIKNGGMKKWVAKNWSGCWGTLEGE